MGEHVEQVEEAMKASILDSHGLMSGKVVTLPPIGKKFSIGKLCASGICSQSTSGWHPPTTISRASLQSLNPLALLVTHLTQFLRTSFQPLPCESLEIFFHE
jgi:hypothetical protein